MSADNPLTEALSKMASAGVEQAMAGIAASLAKIAGTATDPKMAAFEGLLNEVSAALTDVVAALERPDGDAAIAKAITDGLKALRIEVAAPKVSVEAPRVDVHVAPTPIQLTVPKPVVQVIEREDKGAVFEVDVKWRGNFIDTMRVTRIPAK